MLELLLVCYCLVPYIGNILIFTANNFWSFNFAIAFVYLFAYLEEFSPLNSSLFEYDN